MDDTQSRGLSLVTLCIISVVVGAFFFWMASPAESNSKMPLFSGLMTGFGAAWLANVAVRALRRRQKAAGLPGAN